jgi:hypothetical protein
MPIIIAVSSIVGGIGVGGVSIFLFRKKRGWLKLHNLRKCICYYNKSKKNKLFLKVFSKKRRI